ncbi:Eco57I restriction-modification methylase domain-containing protein [Scytonema millei]|uniref:site-specific DNA-methyltransferase (adenine-specific) n=1 Tax=Scytonema millei VB511283 TaxID=1245923 RepID=A0A9X5I3A9_9CYAN|nr:Eco57I restriction-modification methylase domain-containing protein [Scytonema millei]NHC33344.1 SAM-dependent DNA methyltransferase [Scytonema millei VB511283]
MTLQNLDCEQSNSIDLTEAKRVVEQIQLDASKNSVERNRLGQFATPNSLAIEVLKYSKTLLPASEEIHFLDPAIGNGSFYSALLQSFPSEQIKSTVGYEIDRGYAEVALKLWDKTSLTLNIADFTESVPPQNEKFRSNLLICNPPYVRHHHLSSDKKISLKRLGIKTTGIELSGLAGLYCYFILAAHGWMARNGLACWIIPSEFMDVNYGEKLKQYLLERVTLLRVHRFAPENLQFTDVLVSTSVIWFRNTKPNHDYFVEFTYGESISRPSCSETISSRVLKEISKWNRTSISPTQKNNIHSGAKLSELFEIKRGIATGANNFFILTPDRVNELSIPFEFLTPILPSPRYLLDDEILSDEQGNPRLERKLFVLNCKQPMEYFQVKYPLVWNYLQQGEKIGISARYLCKHRSLWYLQEIRHPTMFLCPYMGRHKSRNSRPFRFILNHSKAIAPNVYLMMYPKMQLETLISTNFELRNSVWKALNSIPIQNLIHEGRVYGDGLHKLEPRELANAPADLLLKALEKL